MPIVVKARSFEAEVLKAKLPVLVDFWGARCGPCRLQRPILLELARECAGQLKICMFNTDPEEGESEEEYREKYDALLEYGVRSLPTLLLFSEGKLVRGMVGLHSREELLEILREEGLAVRPEEGGPGGEPEA